MAGGQTVIVAGTTALASIANAYWSDEVVMRVTSGTRPTAAAQSGGLLAGMTIFETDTFKLQQYTTGTTLWTPPWNLPWGLVAKAIATTNQTGISSATAL